jgi:DNA excision repair protein ERCC-4
MSSPDVVDVVGETEGIAGTAVARRDPVVRHELRVDPSEQHAALLDLARQCDDFDVRMGHLPVGDYCVDRGIVVERKTHADFAVSLVDGRLFPQAAKLARCPHRPIILIEGPCPVRMPDVHPHALKGAIVSLAVMWRLPVLYARDPEDSLRILRCLADQLGSSDDGVLKRYGRKPKRLASRKLYMLQGLPGVGPALAHRLLREFGSIERVVTADEAALMRVRGVGRQRAAHIRELIG